jgi:hypothetical protein
VIDPLPEGFVPLVESGSIPLVLRGTFGLSEVVLVTPQLTDGNLTRHPAFPILVVNVVRGVSRFTLPESVPSGTVVTLPAPEEYHQLTIKTPQDDEEIKLNGQAVFSGTLVPGFYLLEHEDLDGNLDYYAFGVNAGSKEESNSSPRDWSAALPAPGEQPIVSAAEGMDLTPWLLGAVALLMVVEARQAWR